MKTLTIQCPDQLVHQLDVFVRDGWATDTGDAVVEALRRFLESHQPDIARKQTLADLEWGLHGKD